LYGPAVIPDLKGWAANARAVTLSEGLIDRSVAPL